MRTRLSSCSDSVCDIVHNGERFTGEIRAVGESARWRVYSGVVTREYFVNADFDVSLRPNWGVSAAGSRARQAGEMPHHLLLLALGGNSVLLDEAPDEDFERYLRGMGFPPLLVSVFPDVRRDAELTPFGWNREAEELSAAYSVPSIHPPLEVVRRVNGRRFAAALEKEILGDDEVLGTFTSIDEFEACLSNRPVAEDGWIVKADHGNAGLGNRRLRTRTLSEADRGAIVRLLAEDTCVLLERWRARVLDLSSIFEIDARGRVIDLRIHQVVNTADGAFIGGIFERDSRAVAPWRGAITRAVSAVADRLAEAGYFGPVCLDSFVWESGAGQRLRAVVDINARLSVSIPAQRLWRTWGGDTVVYWRLFSTRKLRLPQRYPELARALGDRAFDASTQRGVLLTSPLRSDGRRRLRVGVLLAGETRAEVEQLDRWLRGTFEN